MNNGTLTLMNTTLSGNTAVYIGGGIFNYASATLTVASSTLSGNSAAYGGGIYNHVSSVATLNNTIVANSPTGGDLSGAFAGSHNLIEDGSGTGLTGTIVADPNLGTLADNGGPTRTFVLLVGSFAIDAGDNTLIPVSIITDQRGTGYARIVGGTVDIGAFESN